MAYIKHNWQDLETGGTLVTAQKLNEMEQGIEDAQTGGVHVDTALDKNSTAPVTNKAIAERFEAVQLALDDKLSKTGIDDLEVASLKSNGEVEDGAGNKLSVIATLIASALTVDSGMAELRVDNANHRVILVVYKDTTKNSYYYITFSASGYSFAEV